MRCAGEQDRSKEKDADYIEVLAFHADYSRAWFGHVGPSSTVDRVKSGNLDCCKRLFRAGNFSLLISRQRVEAFRRALHASAILSAADLAGRASPLWIMLTYRARSRFTVPKPAAVAVPS